MTMTRDLRRPELRRKVVGQPIAALALAAAGIAAPLSHSAEAQQRRGGAGTGGAFANPAFLLWTAADNRFDALAEELELTESQRESATALVAEIREENGAALSSFSELMTRMRNRTGAAGGRPGGQRRAGGGAGGGGGQLRQMMTELRPVLEGFQTDFRALLNEEQAEKLDEISRRRPPGR